MTGLDHKKDRIIEIAVLVTNGNLEMVDEGVEFVIKTEKEILDGMNAWCVDQHGRVSEMDLYFDRRALNQRFTMSLIVGLDKSLYRFTS